MLLEVIADGALAALANILSGALVAPDLASARLRASLADALQAMGHSVSGYAGAQIATEVSISRPAWCLVSEGGCAGP